MSIRSRGRAPSRPALAFTAALALLCATAASASPQPSTGPLRLETALALAVAADPAAAGWTARLKAADADLRQAGVHPNPTLGVELENFAGTGAYSLLDRTEATLSYQQTFERGGKLDARTARARAQGQAVSAREEVHRLDLMRDVQVAYAEALAAEAALLVAEARLISAHQSQGDIDRRVRSARDPLFAGSRAEATTAQAEIGRDQARDAARNARAVLARHWGGGPDFSLDLEPFFAIAGPVGSPSLAAADAGLLEAARDVATANVRVEQARAVTDPILRAGVRYLGEGDDVAFIVGGTLPLRLHDANKGGVERALAERAAAEADLAAARLLREREAARLLAQLAASARESERIRTEVIPAAIRTVEQVREGFNRGGFQYLDVTEAERALVAARERRVVVLRQFHIDQAALDRLTGRHVGLIPNPVAESR